MNSKTVGAVRKLKDADGRFLWSDATVAGEPARLIGYPVLIVEDMPDIGADSMSIAFGDFANGYTIAELLTRASCVTRSRPSRMSCSMPPSV